MEKHEQTRDKRADSPEQAQDARVGQQNAGRILQAVRAEGKALTGAQLAAMPPEELRQLAALLGNSALGALLGGGESGPDTFAFKNMGSFEGDTTENPITTVKPALTDIPALTYASGMPLPAASPADIAER